MVETFCFLDKKWNFKAKMVKTISNIYIKFFIFIKCFVYQNRAVLYNLIFEFHEDGLFHSYSFFLTLVKRASLICYQRRLLMNSFTVKATDIRVVMLSVDMVSVVMLSVIMLSVIMLCIKTPGIV